MKEEMVSELEGVRTIKDYFSALQTGDMGALGALFAEDVVWHQPGNGRLSGTYRGKENVFSLLGKFMEISEGSFRIDDISHIMGNGDLVSATLHFTATRPGRSMAMDGVDLMRVEGGRIKEVWLFSSDTEAEDRFWS